MQDFYIGTGYLIYIYIPKDDVFKKFPFKMIATEY